MPYLKLFNIQAKDWVLITSDKMKVSGSQDASSWNAFWEETCYELGGNKSSISCKGCPKKAAYVLWYLGRIKNTGRDLVDLPINEVAKNYQKMVLMPY